MISIILVIVCCYLAFQVSIGVHKQTSIFVEFEQQKTILWLVWLVPIGVFLTIYLSSRFGFLIAVIQAAICFSIVAYEAHMRASAFDKTGTNRTAEALKLMQQATLIAIIGFIYLGVNLVFILIAGSSSYF